MTHQPGALIQQQARGLHHGYQLLAVDDYKNRFGFASKLLTWLGTCAVCGRQFTARSGRRPKGLVRTCGFHRGQFRRRPTKRIKDAA
jgi:hypothetical protein